MPTPRKSRASVSISLASPKADTTPQRMTRSKTPGISTPKQRNIEEKECATPNLKSIVPDSLKAETPHRRSTRSRTPSRKAWETLADFGYEEIKKSKRDEGEKVRNAARKSMSEVKITKTASPHQSSERRRSLLNSKINNSTPRSEINTAASPESPKIETTRRNLRSRTPKTPNICIQNEETTKPFTSGENKRRDPYQDTSISMALSAPEQSTSQGGSSKRAKIVSPKQQNNKISMPSLISEKIECPVPCREVQFDEIWNFLRQGIEDRDSRCLYVSGVPGTGKTLVVKTAIDTMMKLAPNSFKYIFVNSLNLGAPDRIWNRVYKGLGLGLKDTGNTSKIAPAKAFCKVEKYLLSKHLPVILVVDELDQLLDKRQSIIYRILEMTNNPDNKLLCVTIFNTMNLPETTLASRNYSRMGFGRVIFAPYTNEQLQQIVRKHLGEDKITTLQPKPLILLSKKVAGISGDARRAIEIANRTLEIIESRGLTGTQAIQDAFKELFSSPHIQCLRYCSTLEKAIIRSLAAILSATGEDFTFLSNVIQAVKSHAHFEGTSWNIDQILAAIGRLYSTRLILIEPQPSIHGKISLNVAIEDVNFAIGKSPQSQNED